MEIKLVPIAVQNWLCTAANQEVTVAAASAPRKRSVCCTDTRQPHVKKLVKGIPFLVAAAVFCQTKLGRGISWRSGQGSIGGVESRTSFRNQETKLADGNTGRLVLILRIGLFANSCFKRIVNAADNRSLGDNLEMVGRRTFTITTRRAKYTVSLILSAIPEH
jgi:hypothetical protein